MHKYSSYFNCIILFIDILSLYAINLNVVSLFAKSSSTFLAMLNDVIYQFKWINIVLILKKKLKDDKNNFFKYLNQINKKETDNDALYITYIDFLDIFIKREKR